MKSTSGALSAVLAALFLAGCFHTASVPQHVPLVCYFVESTVTSNQTRDVKTQFGVMRDVHIGIPDMICEPAYKEEDPDDLPREHPKQLPLVCYHVEPVPLGKRVKLSDQFFEQGIEAFVEQAVFLCDPVTVKKLDGKPQGGKAYPTPLLVFQLTEKELKKPVPVSTRDQFGVQGLSVETLRYLMEPAEKSAVGILPKVKPLTCYIVSGGKDLNRKALLTDQFTTDREYKFRDPYWLCDPAGKTVLPDLPPDPT